MTQKRIKQIGVCVVGETLLLAKAKSSKNFCKDSRYTQIYFVWITLRECMIRLAMTNRGRLIHLAIRVQNALTIRTKIRRFATLYL